jgi:TonB-linked SusC/RagA family outer membrane protein
MLVRVQASTSVVILLLTGSSQPLWVVDGIPFNSATNNSAGFTTGGTATSSSRFLDIDPNNIESINVLRGLSATVLYGDQGRNGVILVTTKAGTAKKRASEITFQQTTSINEIASWPTFQNDYGNGFQQFTGQSATFFSNWGPHFNQIDSLGHPYQFAQDLSLRDEFPQFFFKRVPYEASPTPRKFFRNGVVSNSSLNFAGGSDKLGYNTSVSYTNEQGYAPGNDLKRINISTGFNAAVTDKLSVRTSIQYANTDLASPPLNGATGGGAAFNNIPSLYGQFLYTPRNIDVMDFNSYPFQTSDFRSVYFRPGNDIPNTNWMARYIRETELVNRFTISNSVVYDFNQHLNLTYRVGLDTYNQGQTREFNKGITPSYEVINRGIYQTQSLTNTIWNHDLIMSYNKSITSDIGFSGIVGLNARNDKSIRDGSYSEGQVVFGLFNAANFSTPSTRSVAFDGRVFQRVTEQQRYGVYTTLKFDYKNYIFLTLSGRNDWISSLEPGNNSLFYPSADASVNLAEAIPGLKSNKINFLKLRVAYGTSAGFPPVYITRTLVGQNLRGFVNPAGTLLGEQTIGNRLGNPNLRAELIQELEAGVEAKFFNDRFGVDFTVYDRSTRDLITEAPVDPATGYTSTFLNLGRLSNKGIEFQVTGNPVRLANGFRWDVIWNYTLVRPVVESLGGSLSEVVLSGFTNRGNFAVVGQPTYLMKGTGILKAADGQRIVRSDGLYQQDPILQVLGNPNPDYVTTLINTLSYKGFTFSFQFDYRKGGMMYASTASATLGRGVANDVSAYNHDLALILPGVKVVSGDPVAGTAVYAKNDIQVTASDYGFNVIYGAGATDEVNMFDITTIRLREASIGYNFPRAWFTKTPIKQLSIQLNGNNLWFNAVNVPKSVNFDPEVSSQGVDNGLGFDYLTGPSSRRYGAVLRLTF